MPWQLLMITVAELTLNSLTTNQLIGFYKIFSGDQPRQCTVKNHKKVIDVIDPDDGDIVSETLIFNRTLTLPIAPENVIGEYLFAVKVLSLIKSVSVLIQSVWPVRRSSIQE
jgi:hypothetical protein